MGLHLVVFVFQISGSTFSESSVSGLHFCGLSFPNISSYSTSFATCFCQFYKKFCINNEKINVCTPHKSTKTLERRSITGKIDLSEMFLRSQHADETESLSRFLVGLTYTSFQIYLTQTLEICGGNYSLNVHYFHVENISKWLN